MQLRVKVKKMDKEAIVPIYQTEGAAGFDLHAVENLTIKPRSFAFIRLGLAFEVPDKYELQIRSRSGLAKNYGIQIHHGTIDSDFRGETGCIAFNHGEKDFHVKIGDRICQGVLSPIVKAEFEESDNLNETERGSSGFGSTGK